MSEQIQLSSLVGKHLLTGVDFETSRVEEWKGSGIWVDAAVVNFTLDGITYTAIEDPGDGYRSNMKELLVSQTPTKNTFPPIKVKAVMRAAREYEDGCDVLQLFCQHNNALVLEVGTENVADYYPGWVAGFKPEAMA